jgi:hypothetical protein
LNNHTGKNKTKAKSSLKTVFLNGINRELFVRSSGKGLNGAFTLNKRKLAEIINKTTRQRIKVDADKPKKNFRKSPKKKSSAAPKAATAKPKSLPKKKATPKKVATPLAAQEKRVSSKESTKVNKSPKKKVLAKKSSAKSTATRSSLRSKKV